ncbi:MAG: hypothetical protein ACI9KF_000622 [Arenicella sp.]|jgi:hypothetical protein
MLFFVIFNKLNYLIYFMTNNHLQLLIDVQKKSNIIINNVGDIKYLKEAIESFNDLKIGYNTLRRLFGFLNKTKPSLSTLNTLSNYLEFTSYTNYLTNKLNFDEWYFQQRLLQIQHSNDLDEEAIQVINSGMLYDKNIVYVAYFISTLIQKNNLITLNKVFEKIELSEVEFSKLLQFATIITHSFYSIGEDKALIMYNDLLKHENFKNAVPLLYIDYSNLKGVYFKVLKLIEKQSLVASDLFFVTLMGFYRQFYTEGICENQKIIRPVGFHLYNLVLKGRFYGCKIMSVMTIDSVLKKELFKEFAINKTSWFAMEVLPALLIKEQYKILTELSDKFYEQIFTSDEWCDETMSSIYLIALANISWYNNEISIAKINLELVVLGKVELSYYDYVSLFYYQTKIKISYSEKDLIANINSFLVLEKLVVKTGFTKFLEVSKKYILN